MFSNIQVLMTQLIRLDTNLHLAVPLFVFLDNGPVLLVPHLLILQVGLDPHHHNLLCLHTSVRILQLKKRYKIINKDRQRIEPNSDYEIPPPPSRIPVNFANAENALKVCELCKPFPK